jgi:hypothetical protein
VDLYAKFLCKKRSPENKETLYTLTQEEGDRLEAFHKLESAERMRLTNYSRRLYTKNKPQWNRWMKRPIDEQAQIARTQSGGAQ